MVSRVARALVVAFCVFLIGVAILGGIGVDLPDFLEGPR